MSYLMTDDIIKNNDLNLSEKVVLAFLTSQGVCKDPLEVMRCRIGVGSLSTLRNTLKSLVSKGYVSVKHGHSNSPATYSVVNDQNTYSTSVKDDLQEVFDKLIDVFNILGKYIDIE